MDDEPRCRLHLNVDKTKVFWPVFSPSIARPMHGVKLLGGPASVPFDFCNELVMKRVAKTIALMDAVAKINDPQCKLLLLRSYTGISRLYFTMRTCPPCAFESAQHSFDVALRSSLERIVAASGKGFGDWQWRLSTLPFLFGGLGVYSAKDVLNYAFISSRLQSADLQTKLLQHTACSMVFARDIYGDDVVSCAGIIGIKHRHNVMRDTLVDIYFSLGISAGLDVCVDLTRSSPLTQTEMTDFVPGRAVIVAAQCKRVKYMDKCAAIGYGFLSFSFSSLEELEEDAVTLLKRIRKFSMVQDIGALAVVRIFNMISFAIAKGMVAQRSVGLQTKLRWYGGVVTFEPTLDDDVCVFNTTIGTGLLSNSGISVDKEVDIGLGGGRDKPLRPSDMLLYSWYGRPYVCVCVCVCVDLIGSSPLTHTGMVDFVPIRTVIEATHHLGKQFLSVWGDRDEDKDDNDNEMGFIKILDLLVAGDGVAGIKRRRRDLSSDGVRNMATASGRGRLKEDLESSTWRRRDKNPILTLVDYSKPSHEGNKNTIELPVGNNVVPLRSDTIRLVQNRCSFHRLRFEDPNQHLKDFLKLVDSFDLDGENRERTRMTAKLRNDILMFQQHHGESLSEAWTHFKDLLQKVPHHGIDRWLQIQIFYDHVSFHLKCEIDRAVGGKIHNKNPDESWEIIENLALYNHEGRNDAKEFIKPVKAISTPQPTSKMPDQRLLELEDQINFLLKGSRPTPRPSSTHVPQAYAEAVYSNPRPRNRNELLKHQGRQ
ncbi:hypothetical protein Tco_0904339 [Tanacetum coccineum]